MFNIFKKKNNQKEKYLFYISYGYVQGVEGQNFKNPRFVQKAICSDLNAEIYKIGDIIGDSWPVGEIYILILGQKTIPFILPPFLTIANKQFSAHVKRFERDLMIAKYQVPVVSASVISVGKDLNALPRGRDHSAFYERNVFNNSEDHSYKFVDQNDYNKVLEIISDGLPILLYERYNYSSYNPVIPFEILFEREPWNLQNDLYLNEHNILKNHYNSKCRQAYYIQMQLDLGKQRSASRSLLDVSHQSRSFEFKILAEEGDKWAKQLYENALQTVKLWTEDFENKVKTAEDFIIFIKSHLEPTPPVGQFLIDELQQKQANEDLLFEHLASSNYSVMQDFYNYKKALEDEAVEKAEIYFSKIGKKPLILEKFEDFVKQNLDAAESNLSIEDIMTELIRHENGYHHVNDWQHGSTSSTHYLKDHLFIELIKKVYNEHYKNFITSHEQILIMITETLVERVSMRIAKEKTETCEIA
jgi:hypothetical protein